MHAWINVVTTTFYYCLIMHICESFRRNTRARPIHVSLYMSHYTRAPAWPIHESLYTSPGLTYTWVTIHEPDLYTSHYTRAPTWPIHESLYTTPAYTRVTIHNMACSRCTPCEEAWARQVRSFKFKAHFQFKHLAKYWNAWLQLVSCLQMQKWIGPHLHVRLNN